MVAGLPSSMTVEIEWTAGTWTDVTPWVASEAGMSGTFGRATEFDDCSAGTWALTLRNDDGRFTPDNPLSPYFPNVDENSRVRVTAYRGVTAYPRFLGYVTSIEPSFPDADSTRSIVEIRSADLVSALSRRTTETGYAEQSKYIARYNGQWNDLFVFPTGGASTATYFQNSGNTVAGVVPGTASILTPANSVGSWEVSSPDANLVLDGQLHLNPSAITGPVLKILTTGGAGQIDFFLNVPETVSISPGGTALTVVDVWSETANLFSFRLYYDNSTSSVHLGAYSAAGAWQGGVESNAVYNMPKINDGQWHKLTIIDAAAPGGLGGTGVWTNIDDSIWQLNWASFPALTGTTRLIFGGSYGGPSKEAKTTNCPEIYLAGINIEQANQGVWGYFALGTPPATTAGARFAELLGYAGQLVDQKKAVLTFTSGSSTVTSPTPFFTTTDVGKALHASTVARPWPFGAYVQAYVSPTQVTISAPATSSGTKTTTLSGLMTGTLDRPVVRVNTLDSENLAESFANLARTIGGVFWVNPAGVTELVFPDQMRLKTPIATVDIEADVDGDTVELRRSVDQSPTQVTVQSPIGNVVLSTTVGLAQSRRDTSIDTGAVNDAAGRSIAGYYLTTSQTLRITQLGVSVASAQNDLYAAFLGSLKPGARLRVAGLPTTIFGRSWADVYVQGWTEAWDRDDVLFTFDCTPADDPVEGIVGDNEYGRVAGAELLTLAAAITATDTTLSVTRSSRATATTPLITTTSADYPLDLDVMGERVTLAAPPSSTVTRTNLVTNPSFGTGTTGWTGVITGKTTSTLATTPSISYLGGAALQVTWPAAASGATGVAYTATVTAGATYAFSVYVYVPPGSPNVQLSLVTGSGSTSYAGGQQSSAGTVGGWVRLGMQVTSTGTSLGFGITTAGASTAGQVVYVDAALLEQGFGAINSYFDGEAGGVWTGTAHASTSTQTVQTFTGATRGIAPSVARAHPATDYVDVWHEAAVAF